MTVNKYVNAFCLQISLGSCISFDLPLHFEVGRVKDVKKSYNNTNRKTKLEISRKYDGKAIELVIYLHMIGSLFLNRKHAFVDSYCSTVFITPFPCKFNQFCYTLCFLIQIFDEFVNFMWYKMHERSSFTIILVHCCM